MSPYAAGYPTWAKLRAVASAQRRVVLLFLLAILANVGLRTLAEVGGAAGGVLVLLAALALVVALVVSVYRLARALDAGVPWLWAAASWLSCLGLVLILILNARATALLKRSGVKVGFLGVKELPAVPPPGVLTSDVGEVFG